MTNKELGAKGEYLARLFLEQKGFIFIRANYTTPVGEIDLILQENDEIVFVEVKTRTIHSALSYGRGAEKIDFAKRQRIQRAARIFLREEPRLTDGLLPRFDAIELYLSQSDSNKVHVLHTPCAFGL